MVSGGELERALKVGANPKSIVYAGVGKTDDEINAALDAGILMFNVESQGELDRIAELATAKGWELAELHLESGRLDEVFRTITGGAAA